MRSLHVVNERKAFRIDIIIVIREVHFQVQSQDLLSPIQYRTIKTKVDNAVYCLYYLLNSLGVHY